jgi:hypothetical protein
LQIKQVVKDSAYRPQANFMPEAPTRGSIPITRQKPSRRVQEEEAKKAAAATAAAAI